MSSEWSRIGFQPPLARQALAMISNIRGLLEGSAIIASTVASFLELLAPIAALQQGTKFAFDSSKLGNAIISLLAGLTQDPVELYVLISESAYRRENFNSLMRLMSDSIGYRHLGVIGAHIPGVNDVSSFIAPEPQPDITRLGVDTGVGVISKFSGFALILTADNRDDLTAQAQLLKDFLVQKSPLPGPGDVPSTRSYSYDRLITPLTLPIGQLFVPVWDMIKALNTVENITRGVASATDRLKILAEQLQAKADILNEYSQQLKDLEESILGLAARPNAFNLITFSNLDFEELLPCWLDALHAPNQEHAMGIVGIIADPIISKTLDLVLPE